MSKLDSLRSDGWSYQVGYSQNFKSYMAKAWKPRPKPEKVPSPGGGHVTLVDFWASAIGDSIEHAALSVYEKIITGSAPGDWWSGLPITRIVK